MPGIFIPEFDTKFPNDFVLDDFLQPLENSWWASLTRGRACRAWHRCSPAQRDADAQRLGGRSRATTVQLLHASGEQEGRLLRAVEGVRGRRWDMGAHVQLERGDGRRPSHSGEPPGLAGHKQAHYPLLLNLSLLITLTNNGAAAPNSPDTEPNVSAPSAPFPRHERQLSSHGPLLKSPLPVAPSAPQRCRHSLLHTSGVVAISSKFSSVARARAARALYTNSNNRPRFGRRTCRLEPSDRSSIDPPSPRV